MATIVFKECTVVAAQQYVNNKLPKTNEYIIMRGDILKRTFSKLTKLSYTLIHK